MREEKAVWHAACTAHMAGSHLSSYLVPSALPQMAGFDVPTSTEAAALSCEQSFSMHIHGFPASNAPQKARLSAEAHRDLSKHRPRTHHHWQYLLLLLPAPMWHPHCFQQPPPESHACEQHITDQM